MADELNTAWDCNETPSAYWSQWNLAPWLVPIKLLSTYRPRLKLLFSIVYFNFLSLLRISFWVLIIGSRSQDWRMFHKFLLHFLREESFAERLTWPSKSLPSFEKRALVCSLASSRHSDPSATLPLSLSLKYNKDSNGYIISVLNWVRANPHWRKSCLFRQIFCHHQRLTKEWFCQWWNNLQRHRGQKMSRVKNGKNRSINENVFSLSIICCKASLKPYSFHWAMKNVTAC